MHTPPLKRKIVKPQPSPYRFEREAELSLINELRALRQDIIETADRELEKIDKSIKESKQIADETKEDLKEVKKLSQKIENDFESLTNELVDVLKEIKSQGLKGDKGDSGVDVESLKRDILSKVPSVDVFEIERNILSKVPKIDEEALVRKTSSRVKVPSPDIKIITADLRGEDIVPKLNNAENIGDLRLSIENIKDWDKKWGDIKTEISRNKGGYHGGGFNNILSSGTVVSTGLDNLNFTGATVTQSGRTVTVAVSGGGFTILTTSDTIDDSNVTFTFTGTPSVVVINGQSWNAGSTSGGVVVWTNVGAIVTLANPVGDGGSIYAIQ